MAGIAQNGQKCLIFIVVPLLRLDLVYITNFDVKKNITIVT